jgi:type IV pilus assembly protein PilF
MQYKYMTKWILVTLMCIFLNACSTTQNTTKSLSKVENAELLLQLGARYLEMDMLSMAKERLERSLRLDSNNAEIHNVLGVLYDKLKRYDMAAEQYSEAIAISPDDAGIINNYGRFLCERGNYDKGMQLLNQALDMQLNNRKWFAYTNIARCKLRKGDQAQAEIDFRQALQANSRYSPALFEMQKISYRTGKYMSARAFLERYLAVSTHTAQTLWYAVQTERSLGNKALADVYRQKLFNLFPASKETQQLKTAIRR